MWMSKGNFEWFLYMKITKPTLLNWMSNQQIWWNLQFCLTVISVWSFIFYHPAPTCPFNKCINKSLLNCSLAQPHGGSVAPSCASSDVWPHGGSTVQEGSVINPKSDLFIIARIVLTLLFLRITSEIFFDFLSLRNVLNALVVLVICLFTLDHY